MIVMSEKYACSADRSQVLHSDTSAAVAAQSFCQYIQILAEYFSVIDFSRRM